MQPHQHPLGEAFVEAMNALHDLMRENPDPEVVQTVSQCIAALAKLQTKSFQMHNQSLHNQSLDAVSQVLGRLGA